MKMNYILNEIRLMWHSKLLGMIAFLLCLFSALTIFFNYNQTISLNDSYNTVVNYYKENNMDLDADLNSNSYSISEENGVSNIENPLGYYYTKLGVAIFSTSPFYSSSLLCESSILLLPIIFGVLGLIIGTIDHKNKTIKHKVTRIGKDNYIFSKILSIIFVNLILIILYFIFGKIFSIIAYSNLKDVIDFTKVSSFSSSLNTSFITKVFFTFSIATIYSIIGILLGELFKSTLIGSIAIILYCTIIPLFSKFDLKNSIYYFSNKVCDFMGSISLSGIKDTSTPLSFFMISIIFILSIGIYILLVKKRSAFES